METVLDRSGKTSCESLDFKECSLKNLKNDFPRLFQIDHEQHMYIYIIFYCVFDYMYISYHLEKNQ
jgi:hypothetical protein